MRDGYQTMPLNCGYLPGNSTCVPYGCGSTRCGKRRKVTFKNVGSNWERITATPKSGGPSYVYEIRVKSWWVNSGDAFMIYSLAENFCSSNGYTLPRADHLNHSRSRGIGSLYSEWGDMGHYTTEAGFRSNMYWSSSPANSSEQYVVSLATGDQSVFEKLGFAYATCYKNL